MADLFTSESFVMDVLLLAAIVIAYYPVYQHPFFNFDDPVYVVNNPHIAAGLSWDTVAWAFSTFYQFNWHPLTWISHAFDVQLFHLVPAGHHVMNVLLHAANVLLLCWVLRHATGYVGRSAMVAALFALHPINVESVAWVAERKNLLSMFFLLLGMGAYRWYASAASENILRAQRGRFAAPKSRADLARYALMTLCFALGLMAKPQIITFPFILLLWDYWPLGRMANPDGKWLAGTATEPLLPARSFWWLVKEKIPLFAICAASAVVTVIAQRAGGAVATLRNDPLRLRLTNAIVSYGRYLGKAVWPSKLAPLYPHSLQLPLWQVVLSLLVLLAITALVIVQRKQRYLQVGWLWFLGTLVPMIGLVQVGNQAMADRYAYLPFIGLFIMACWPVAELVALVEAPIAAVRTLSALLLLILVIVTDQQLGYWANNVDLWTHTLAVTSGNYIAHDNLAHLLMDQGPKETKDALANYQAALDIYPDDPNSLLALAQYNQQHGKLPEAIARYEQVVRVMPAGPARADLLTKEGLVYLDMHDTASAHACFANAVAMDPENVSGWLGLGVAAEQSGDLQAAIENYKHANSVQPLKITYLLLAKALEESGDISAAQVARGHAQLLPDDKGTTQAFSGGRLQR